MFGVPCAAAAALTVLLAMPLLTELVSTRAGFCYKHGAPNGAELVGREVPWEESWGKG